MARPRKWVREPDGRGDAEQPGGQPVGERVLRRLEAALDTLPGGIAGAGATPGRQAASCENTLGAVPHQALWAGGRSRHGTCRRCATAHPAVVPPRRCRACG